MYYPLNTLILHSKISIWNPESGFKKFIPASDFNFLVDKIFLSQYIIVAVILRQLST